MTQLLNSIDINNIYNEIKELVISSRQRVYKSINHEMVLLYWNIGRIIIDIQDGNSHAKYDERALEKLSIKLTNECDNGFSIRNLRKMRKFYYMFQKRPALSAKLSCSHYLELIKRRYLYFMYKLVSLL